MLGLICILSIEALNILSTAFTNFELCPRNAANSDSELEVFYLDPLSFCFLFILADLVFLLPTICLFS